MLAYYLRIKNWFDGEEGQDLVEYALLVALLVVAAAATLQLAGGQIADFFTAIGDWLDTAGATLP